MRYRARQRWGSNDWCVEREIMCVNGLPAWFTVCDVPEADKGEHFYTNSEISTAQERAERIAEALNK